MIYIIYVINNEVEVSSLKKTYGFYLKLIQDTLERRANNNLRKQDLTVTQLGVLLRLNETVDGTMSLKELESFFCVAQSTMAGIAKRLEQKGLVVSEGSQADKRVKILRLTESGKTCCQETDCYIEENEELLLCGLTSVEKQIFMALLQKICATMQ